VNELSEFDRDIRVTRVDGTTFETITPDGWKAATGRPQGGTIAAQIMLAMIEAVDDATFHPRAFSGHFLRGPGPDPYRIEVVIERTGRTMVNVSARCVQGDKLQVMAMAVFGADRHGPTFDELPMPDLAPPSADRVRESYAPDFAFPFVDRIVCQPRLGPKQFSAPDGPMHNAAWLGFADPRPFDAPGLLVLCDAGLMPWWGRLDSDVPTATVDYTMHFRSNFPVDTPDGLAVVENRTRYVSDGLLDWDAVVWSPHGEVLCLARQQLVTLDQ
jgi:acyl-CoA thioesterase